MKVLVAIFAALFVTRAQTINGVPNQVITGAGVVLDRNYATFAAACTAAGGTTTLLVTKAWTALANQTCTANLRFEKGGSLQPNNAATVTIAGSLEAGLYKIFDLSLGTGVVSGFTTTASPVQWWGAVGDNSTDDTAAINAATLSGGTEILFPNPPSCYKITSPIFIRDYQRFSGQDTTGAGKGVCNYGNTDGVQNSQTGHNTIIEYFNLKDSAVGRTAGHGINITANGASANFRVHKVVITGHMDGFHLAGGTISSIDDAESDSALNDSFNIAGGPAGSTSVTVSNTYGSAPARYCYYTDVLDYSAFSSTACDQSGSDGYHFEHSASGRAEGVTLISPGCEGCLGHGMYFKDSDNVTIISPLIEGIPTGTGLADIAIDGASNMSIISPWLRAGDYGIKVISDGFITPKSVFVSNPQYIQNAISPTLDTFGALRFIIPTNRIATAGTGGVTLNLLATVDASNPTKFILPTSGNCGEGIADTTAASGVQFQLRATAGQFTYGVADNAVTAGHILVGGTTTVGRVRDSGQTLLSAIPVSTCVVGTALASASTAGAVPLLYAGAKTVGTKVIPTQYCGTTSTCAPSILTSPQIVFGSAPLVSGSPSTVTIGSISPAFTSTSSFRCTVSGQTGAATGLYSVANVSGSSITITGPNANTTVVNYICVGN